MTAPRLPVCIPETAQQSHPKLPTYNLSCSRRRQFFSRSSHLAVNPCDAVPTSRDFCDTRQPIDLFLRPLRPSNDRDDISNHSCSTAFHTQTTRGYSVADSLNAVAHLLPGIFSSSDSPAAVVYICQQVLLSLITYSTSNFCDQTNDRSHSATMAAEPPRQYVPLTCHGHSRPVPHIGFSHLEKEETYYLISACKGQHLPTRTGALGYY